MLTARQQQILQVIRNFAHRRGYAPTLHQIGEETGLASRSSVSYQLAILQRKGYLRRITGRPRTIELRLPGQPTVRLEVEDMTDAADIPPQDPASIPVPLYGQIAASPPNLAEQEIGDTWDLPKELVGNGTLFRLRVRGDSMINAAIADGDIVVVRQQPQAENGEIVAALIQGEATGQDPPAGERPGLADATQPCLPADSGQAGHYPRQGRDCPAPRLIDGQLAWRGWNLAGQMHYQLENERWAGPYQLRASSAAVLAHRESR